MSNGEKRATPIERIASMLALMAAACAIGSLLLATGLAYAWLTDRCSISNELEISSLEAASLEPYAALYADTEGNGRTLAFGRGDSAPEDHGRRKLTALWRGMESGDGDFAQSGRSPWEMQASLIDEIVCSDAAQQAPIHVLDMSGWYKGMSALSHADLSGISPDATAQGARPSCTDLSDMFNGCAALKSIEGISRWKTVGQVRARSMFAGCSSLGSIDLSGWDMDDLTSAESMFFGCSNMEEAAFGTMSMRSCTDTSWMFGECRSLRHIDGLDTFYCPRNGSLNRMFWNCSQLTEVDLSGCGMPAIYRCEYMLEGCSSLEYLDISGFSFYGRDRDTWGLFPEQSRLVTFITSNRVNSASAPVPASWTSDDGTIISPGYWLSDETNVAYSTSDLANHLVQIADLTGIYERVSFHRSSFGFTDRDPYAAVYAADDGTYALIMDSGASAPRTLDEMRLVREVRDILVGGDTASQYWKGYPVTTVRILAPLTPLSCRNWFAELDRARLIEGLERLDMSACRDVTRMFYRCGAERLEVGSWHLESSATGFEEMFAFCGSLVRLDLGPWTASATLSLSGLTSLSTLIIPESMRVHSLGQPGIGEEPRFFDGSWYHDGLGASLSPSDVSELVAEAQHKGGDALMFTCEKADRSYAAVYRGNGGCTLVFGRGLDVPEAFDGRVLQGVYRGIEEQNRNDLAWSSFSADACPWALWAASVDRIAAADGLSSSPIRPQGMGRWFQGMTSLTRLDALESGAVDPSNVRDASWLFRECSALTSIPDGFIGSFTSQLTECMAMFSGCASLERVAALPGYAMAHVGDAYRMYEGCTRLQSLDLAAWDISSLYSCASMFRNCTSLAHLSLPPAFAAPQRADGLQLTFAGCASLRALDASSWDLSQSYTLFQTFNGCRSLTSISGAESWDTSRVETMNATFCDCPELVLDCSGWDVGSVTDSGFFSYGSPQVISPFEDARSLSEEEDDSALTEEGAPEEADQASQESAETEDELLAEPDEVADECGSDVAASDDAPRDDGEEVVEALADETSAMSS